MGICQSQPQPVVEEPISTRIENVIIELDEATDELLLPTVGKGYAAAEPPMRQDFKPPVTWYTDDDDEYKPDEDVFGSKTSLQQLQTRLGGKQAVEVVTFSAIDEHAKQAKKKVADSFEHLLDYLTQPIAEDSHYELLTVRALIVWLSHQDIDKGSHGRATRDTPNGYLQLQKERKATFATFFAALCRHADIQCTLIHGVCKGGNYQPGDQEAQLQECIWVAVMVAGSWQLLHPFWVCRTMIGQTLGGWIKLEADGKTVSKLEQSTEGMIQTAFKETYFMPRPEDFKYICYPDESEWQLLPPEATVKQIHSFVLMPFLLPAFFGLGLDLVSLQSCVLDSKHGVVDIVIRCRKAQAFKMVMTYDLFIKESANADDEMIQEGNLPRLVLNSRCEERFSFQIRFPVEGTYKIVFYAGVYEKPLLRVCEFKLNCNQRLANCRLLPINTGVDGWGPGPTTERAGLLLPSHMGGVIHLQAPSDAARSNKDVVDNTACVTFHMDQNMMKSHEYSAVMLSSDTIDDKLARQTLNKGVSCTVDKKKSELIVAASVPREGEYALMIRAGRKGKPKRNVCNYLLTTLQSIREGVPQRKARKALKRAMSEEINVEELALVIDTCTKAKLDERDDDVRAGKRLHAFRLVKQHLEDCHKRRNLDVTKKTITEVGKYRHKLALILETRRVERLKLQLERLGGFTREVPELNKACEELVYMANPKQEVTSTMKALFMLLEEPVDRLDDWAYIQSLLKLSKEHNSNILNRMKTISERELDPKSRRRISGVLHTYTESQVRHSSQAAASFYRWIDGVLEAFGQEKTESDIIDDPPPDS